VRHPLETIENQVLINLAGFMHIHCILTFEALKHKKRDISHVTKFENVYMNTPPPGAHYDLQELIKNLMKSRWILGTRKCRLSIKYEKGYTTTDFVTIAMNRHLCRFETLIIAQHILYVALFQPTILTNGRKIVRIWEDAVGVVHLEDFLGELVLRDHPVLLERKLEEGVTQQGIGRTVAFSGEVNTHRCTRGLHVSTYPGVARGVWRFGKSIEGGVWAQHVRAPNYLRINLFAIGRQSYFELLFADPAPGSDNVTVYFYAHFVRHGDDAGNDDC